MKILHILSQRPDTTGSGVYVQAMIREAGKKKYRNFLVAGMPLNETSAERISDVVSHQFVHFDSSELPYSIPGMSDVMPYPSRRFSTMTDWELDRYERCFETCFTEVAREFRPDIIHSHHLWIATAVARRVFSDLPLVTSSHGSDLRQIRLNPRLRDRVIPACRKINAVLTLTGTQKDEVSGLYGIERDRITVAGAGYDPAVFYPIVKPDPDPVVLLYAGKLSRAKGVPQMLEALADLNTIRWHLHLVGDGSGLEKAEVLTLVDRLGDRVTCHGNIRQNRLADLMRKTHVFILPTFYEGLGLVVLEALACGCRVVTTAFPGLVEILQGIFTLEVDMIPLPRLQNCDEPIQEDIPRFIEALRQSIKKQADLAVLDPSPSMDTVESIRRRYTWPGIFNGVETVYRQFVRAL
jgi:alpha-maltose-1-phosphate synthase